MYNTKFECRYHKEDVFLETDQVNEEEKNYIRDLLYREDFLNIFYIDYNDVFDVFETTMNELYEKIKNCSELNKLMKDKAEKVLLSTDLKSGLVILYSYDYMYLTHKCVSEYLETGSVSQENIDLLDKIGK
jgi:hypothetical protein